MFLKKRRSSSSSNHNYATLEPKVMLACDVSVGNLNAGVVVSEDASGVGYMMHSEQSVHERFTGIHGWNADHFIAVQLDGNQWQYNNSDWVDFNPVDTDRLMAEVFFESGKVAAFENPYYQVEGIPIGVSDDLWFVPNRFAGVEIDGSFEVHGSCIDTASPYSRYLDTSRGKLSGLWYAAAAFEATARQFPDLAIFDDNGAPLLSWRVQILPFIGMTDLYNQFNLNERWDSPHNLGLLDQMPSAFESPNFDSDTKTVFLATSGVGTLFPFTSRPISYGDIHDGSSNTLMFVEADATRAVEWTRPLDLFFNPANPLAGLGNIAPEGFAAVTAGGKTLTIPASLDPANLTNMMLIDDGNVVDFSDLYKRHSAEASLSRISGAVLNYESAHMRFPAHARYDDSGTTPLLSWRVQLLPFLEQSNLYNMFHHDEPWDSPHNLSLLPLMPEVFKHSQLADGMTNFLAVTGERTVFRIADLEVGFGGIADGSSNTALFVEADLSEAVEWTRPADWVFDLANPSAGLGAVRGDGFNMVTADGKVHFVPNTVSDDVIANLMQRNDGQFVDFSEIAPFNDVKQNLRRLALSALNYESANLRFPAHARYGDDGSTPLLSWRVLILPYIEQQALYQQFNLNEPWDSPHNIALLPLMPRIFADPGVDNAAGFTNYLALNHESTVFPTDDRGKTFAQITDGSSSTILFVKANDDQAVEWTRPADLIFDPDNPRDGLDDTSASGFHAALADGSTHFLNNAISDETISLLAQRSDGMTIEESWKSESVPGFFTFNSPNAQQNKLRKATLAALNFESARMRFPAHAIYSAPIAEGGTPLLSWRVQLLPYIEQNNLYQQFRLDEPWDSPHNLSLLPLMPDIYSHPEIENGMTVLQAVTGPGTLFPIQQRGLRFGNISDGSSNTLMFVEANLDRAVPWTKPEDLYYDPAAANADPSDGIGESYLRFGTNVSFADGSTHFIRECVSPEILHEAIQIADGGVSSFYRDIPCVGGTIPIASGVLGDIDQNGVVDFLDIAPFVEVLVNDEYLLEADFNLDGIVSFLDIAPFIAALTST